MWRKIILALVIGLGTASYAFGAELALKDLDGDTHRLSDYRGKWVLVNYWATWCPPCLEEIPELVHFHENHKDTNAVVLGVNMEELEPERLREFVDEQFITYPVLLGNSGQALLATIHGLPTSVLVNPEGEVVARTMGTVTAESIEQFIADYDDKADNRSAQEE